MIFDKLDDVTIADIERLVTDQVRESRTVEFKRDAIGTTDANRKEFLADVSAFANTVGGELVLGIEEADGAASLIVGVDVKDPDAEVLRLQSLIRTGLEPRLPRCEIRWVQGPDDSGVIVVQIPRSFAAPHKVVLGGSARFYGRAGAGKFELDVHELRSAFLAQETVAEKIRRFRLERAAVLQADEGPVPLNDGAKLLVHLIPLAAFTAPPQLGVVDKLSRRLGLRFDGVVPLAMEGVSLEIEGVHVGVGDLTALWI